MFSNVEESGMLLEDLQKLEVGSVVTLIEVDGTEFGMDLMRFHPHNIPLTDLVPTGSGSPIYWQGNRYEAFPCKVEGVGSTSDGSSPSPTLSVSNINGVVSSLCLYYDDLVNAKVRIITTLAHYLDSVNFTNGNPEADPTQEIVETWYIDSKSNEDNEAVSFTLSSPADVGRQIIPARLITGLCEWALRGEYRGANCGYTGSARYDKNDNPTDDPSKDQCAGYVRSCKARFGENNELSFGGFPAASLIGR